MSRVALNSIACDLGLERHGLLLAAGDARAGDRYEYEGGLYQPETETDRDEQPFGKEINIGRLGQLPGDFFLNVKAMERNGLANVRSHPVLATLNGYKASLSIGTTQYFLLKTTTPYRDQTQTVFQETQSFQTIEADVKLDITPYVGSDGLITLEIKPDFRTPWDSSPRTCRPR